MLDAVDVGAAHVRLLAEMDVAALDPSSQLTVIELWQRVAAWVSAQQAQVLVALAGSTRLPGDDEWIAEEIAAALHLAPQTAVGRICTARELTSRLADTYTALSTGRISYFHAAHLAERLAAHGDDVAGAVEAAVLPKAATQTVGQFRRSVAEAIAALDPAGSAERHAAAAKHRDVTVQAEPDGMATLTARGPAPAIYEIFDRVAALAAGSGRIDDRTVGARRFDALVDCMRAGASIDDTVPGARRLVGMLLDLPTALGMADHPGEIPGYGPVPASVAREFAAGAEWQAWLTDAVKGCLAGLGTKSYRPPQRLRDFIEARDRTCRHPGCRQPAWRCDVDHAVPHSAGGCTDPANCGCFCRRHHRLKHESGWHLLRETDGTVRFRSPLGRRHTVDPPDYRWLLGSGQPPEQTPEPEPPESPPDDPPPF